MVNFFIGEIKVRRITIDDVPKLWRAKVQARLDELAEQEQEVGE